MEQKIPRKFTVLKVIPFELRTTNSLNLEKDTCHWQSMRYETSQDLHITKGDIFQVRFSQSDAKI